MRVYISRKHDKISELCEALESLGLEVEALPMIRTESAQMPDELPPSEWIFFSSAEAVRFFFEKFKVIKDRKFAAVGASTAKALREFNSVDFIGDASDIEKTAQTFAALTQGQTVIFPGAENSLRSIQQHKPTNEVIDLTCYRTVLQPSTIKSADILVFSSPSNVDGFVALNKIDEKSICIAFGKSTARRLEYHGIPDVKIPPSLSTEDLLNTIKSLARC